MARINYLPPNQQHQCTEGLSLSTIILSEFHSVWKLWNFIWQDISTLHKCMAFDDNKNLTYCQKSKRHVIES